MNYIKVTTTYPTGGTLLPNAFVDNYMIRANGEYIKVYIYLLRMFLTVQTSAFLVLQMYWNLRSVMLLVR